MLESAGLTLNVIAVNRENEHAVIYFGGNGENVYNSSRVMNEAFTGKAVYYLNYPGYGGSAGLPTESNIIQAAKDLFRYVEKHHRSVALVGRSLGTGVAVNLASHFTVSHLVLVSPYDSIVNVANTHYPFLPNQLLIKDRFDSQSRAHKVTAKILIFAAERDEVIPIKHSLRLIEAFNSDVDLQTARQKVKTYTYHSFNHNNVHLHPDFMHRINHFLNT